MTNGNNGVSSGASNGGSLNNKPKKTFQQEVNDTINELNKLKSEISSSNLKLLEYSRKIDKVQMSIRALSEAASKINKPGLNKLQQMADSLSKLAGAISIMSKQNNITKGGVISELDRVTEAIEKLNKVELKTTHIEEATEAFNELSKALSKVNKKSNVSINVSGVSGGGYNVSGNVARAHTGKNHHPAYIKLIEEQISYEQALAKAERKAKEADDKAQESEFLAIEAKKANNELQQLRKIGEIDKKYNAYEIAKGKFEYSDKGTVNEQSSKKEMLVAERELKIAEEGLVQLKNEYEAIDTHTLEDMNEAIYKVRDASKEVVRGIRETFTELIKETYKAAQEIREENKFNKDKAADQKRIDKQNRKYKEHMYNDLFGPIVEAEEQKAKKEAEDAKKKAAQKNEEFIKNSHKMHAYGLESRRLTDYDSAEYKDAQSRLSKQYAAEAKEAADEEAEIAKYLEKISRDNKKANELVWKSFLKEKEAWDKQEDTRLGKKHLAEASDAAKQRQEEFNKKSHSIHAVEQGRNRFTDYNSAEYKDAQSRLSKQYAAEAKEAATAQAEVDKSLDKETTRIQKEQNKQWNKFNKEQEKYEGNQRKAREKAAADKHKAEEKDRNDQEKLFKHIEARKKANEKKQLDKREEIEEKNRDLELAYVEYSNTKTGSEEEQKKLRKVYRAEEAKKIAEQELNELSELHDAIDKALSMEEIDDAVKRINENGEKLRESIINSYIEPISNTHIEEAKIRNNKQNKSDNADKEVDKIKNRINSISNQINDIQTDITPLFARALETDTESSEYAKLNRRILDKELVQGVLKEELESLHKQLLAYKIINDEIERAARLENIRKDTVKKRAEIEENYSNKISYWTKEINERLDAEKKANEQSKEKDRAYRDRQRADKIYSKSKVTAAKREGINSRIQSGKDRDAYDAANKVNNIGKNARQEALLRLAKSKSIISPQLLEDMISIAGEDFAKKFKLTNDDGKSLARLKAEENLINENFKAQLRRIDDEHRTEVNDIYNRSDIGDEEKSYMIRKSNTKADKARSKLNNERVKALGANNKAMAQVAGKIVKGTIALTATIKIMKALEKIYRFSLEQAIESAKIEANLNKLGDNRDITLSESIAINKQNIDNNFKSLKRAIGSWFDPLTNAVSSITSKILIHLDKIDNSDEKNAPDAARGYYLNGKYIRPDESEINAAQATVYGKAREQGFLEEDVKRLTKNIERLGKSIQKVNSNLSYSDMMNIASDIVLNGSSAGSEYGYVADDQTLSAYVAEKFNIDMAHTKMTDAMKTKLRLDWLSHLNSIQSIEDRQKEINSYKKLGAIIESTSDQLFDFQEVQTMDASLFDIPDIEADGIFRIDGQDTDLLVNTADGIKDLTNEAEAAQTPIHQLGLYQNELTGQWILATDEWYNSLDPAMQAYITKVYDGIEALAIWAHMNNLTGDQVADIAKDMGATDDEAEEAKNMTNGLNENANLTPESSKQDVDDAVKTVQNIPKKTSYLEQLNNMSTGEQFMTYLKGDLLGWFFPEEKEIMNGYWEEVEKSGGVVQDLLHGANEFVNELTYAVGAAAAALSVEGILTGGTTAAATAPLALPPATAPLALPPMTYSGGITTKAQIRSLSENDMAEAIIPLETSEGVNYLASAMRAAGLNSGGNGVNIENFNFNSDYVFTQNKASLRQFAKEMDNELSTLHKERGSQ